MEPSSSAREKNASTANSQRFSPSRHWSTSHRFEPSLITPHECFDQSVSIRVIHTFTTTAQKVSITPLLTHTHFELKKSTMIGKGSRKGTCLRPPLRGKYPIRMTCPATAPTTIFSKKTEAASAAAKFGGEKGYIFSRDKENHGTINSAPILCS